MTYCTIKSPMMFQTVEISFSPLCFQIHKTAHPPDTLTLSLLERPKADTLLFYSVERQTILLVKGEPLSGKGLTEPICPSLFLNTFPPRAAKRGHFVVLLCLTPDDFTRQGERRAPGWGRVNVCNNWNKIKSRKFINIVPFPLILNRFLH